MKKVAAAVSLLVLAITVVMGVPAQGASKANGSADAAADWFSSQGLSVVRSNASVDMPDLSADQLANLQLQKPLNAVEFNASGNGTEASDIWIAPIYVGESVVGTLATVFTGGQSGLVAVTDDSNLGSIVAEPRDDVQIVVEPRIGSDDVIGAWFSLAADGTVTPIDSVAKSVLAGTVSLAQYASLREGLIQTDEESGSIGSSSPGATSTSTTVLRVAVVVLIILLLLIGILVWIRYEHANGEEDAASAPEPDSDPNTPGPKRFRHGVDEIQVLERPAPKTPEEKKNEDPDN